MMVHDYGRRRRITTVVVVVVVVGTTVVESIAVQTRGRIVQVM
jgi:HD-like signal output (HDOD) protein